MTHKKAKATLSRATIEAHLTTAVIGAIGELSPPEDATHLLRTFRALVGIGADLMKAGAGGTGTSDAVLAEMIAREINRVLSKKRLNVRKSNSSKPQVPPGTLGSVVQKLGAA